MVRASSQFEMGGSGALLCLNELVQRWGIIHEMATEKKGAVIVGIKWRRVFRAIRRPQRRAAVPHSTGRICRITGSRKGGPLALLSFLQHTLNRDPQRNLLKWHLRHFDLPFAAGLLGDPHEPVAFQNPDVLLNIFEVAAYHLSKLV